MAVPMRALCVCIAYLGRGSNRDASHYTALTLPTLTDSMCSPVAITHFADPVKEQIAQDKFGKSYDECTGEHMLQNGLNQDGILRWRGQ